MNWNHTSSVIATLININRPKGKRAISPDEVNPMVHSKRGTKLDCENLHILKSLCGSR